MSASGIRMVSASAFRIWVLRYIWWVSQPPLLQDSPSVHRKGWASLQHDASTCDLALPSITLPVYDLECTGCRVYDLEYAHRRVCDLRRARPDSVTCVSVALWMRCTAPERLWLPCQTGSMPLVRCGQAVQMTQQGIH